jgi:hypothetical protein
MKKKWIALKRRWKKLNDFERTYFKVDSIFLIAGMILLVTDRESGYFLVGWMFSNILLRISYLAKNRTNRYSSYKEGRIKQKRIDSKDIQTVLRRFQEVDFKNVRLNSDYKKLEYDYNQLKKNINHKKNKK